MTGYTFGSFFTPKNFSNTLLHREGYAEYSGLLLQKYYATTEQVDRLLALGDMSSLGISVSDCLFYNRDCKESWEQVKPKLRNLQEICSEEWVYIWNGTQWMGSESNSFDLVTIQELVAVQSS